MSLLISVLISLMILAVYLTMFILLGEVQVVRHYVYAHYQNNDAPVLSEPQAILPQVKPGGSITITSDDLTQGFTDPEGDQIYISGLRTKYGDWEINEDER